MIIIGFFFFEITAHELAHHWFGNLVICATWNDIWINEGFASYSEFLAHEFISPPGYAENWMYWAHYVVMEIPDGSVYVYPADALNVNRIFNYRLTYKKGAAIIHQLRLEMQNDSLFFESLRSFLNVYKDSMATGEDFKQIAEDVSGMNLDYFFDLWYYGEGFPIFDILWHQENDTVHINITQMSSAGAEFFDMLYEMGLSGHDFDTIVRLRINAQTNNYSIPFTETVTLLRPDPNFWSIDSIRSNTNLGKGNSGQDFFNVFPNPCVESFEINGIQNSFTWTLYGLLGQHIKSGQAYGSTLISVNELAAGLYYLGVESMGQKYFSKIIVSK